jgi:hypothetical protein
MLRVGATNFPPPPAVILGQRSPWQSQALPTKDSCSSLPAPRGREFPRVARTLLSAAVDVALPLTRSGMEEGVSPVPPEPMYRGRPRPRALKGHGFSHAATTLISVQAPRGQMDQPPSRKAAQKSSPRREPRKSGENNKPQRGERLVHKNRLSHAYKLSTPQRHMTGD